MFSYKWMILIDFTALPRMLSGKESACNAGDVGLIRKTPRRQNCNPLQYSCLENPMDRGAWWATVHVVTKSWAWRRNSTCTHNASLVTFCYPHSVSSVQSLSHVHLFATPWIAARQASLSITNSRVHSDPRPSSHWCHPDISSFVVPFSSCPQSLPASESFPLSQLFAWSGQNTGVSASASFLPKKSQGWSPSEWTGWLSLQSQGLSRTFSNTTVQKYQFFSAQPSSQSNFHIHTWPQEKP